MPRTLLITEIIRRAEQGTSQPYICRAEDGDIYFVKGHNTTRTSQISEWICSHLARVYGLPIPEFCLVFIDLELWQETRADYQHIGYGTAFGSKQVPGAQWFEGSFIGKIDNQLQMDILVFDWWVRNLDRTLFNTNLLWHPLSATLTVIDFNNVFEQPFDKQQFIEQHIFSGNRDRVFNDLEARARYQSKLAACLPAWDTAIASLPEEWQCSDLAQTIASNYDFTQAKTILELANTDQFWSLI